MDKLEYYFNGILTLYLPQVLLAVITLVIGLWIIKKLVVALDKVLEKKEVDQSLKGFLNSLFSILLKILLVLSVIEMVGIETTSFIAVFAAAGFAVGLALQGGLANFAGGVMILIFKPFKADDLITSNGYTGAVLSIEIFNTILKTADNQIIILPNAIVSNNPIININKEALRRVDFVFGIGYNDDIKKSKNIIKGLLDDDKRILGDPAPVIVVSELADSSVNLTVRAWSTKENYWGVFFDLTENVKLKFDDEGISIPFPQTDVHLFKQ